MYAKPIIAIAILGAAALCCSCQRRPDGVLPESESVELMSDLQLAQAYMDANYNDYRTEQARRSMKLAVLRKHGVTEKQLDATLSWYGHNADQYSRLYDKVAKRLEKEKGSGSGGSAAGNSGSEGNSLWPYGRFLNISELGNTDGIAFSLTSGVTKGDQLQWRMKISRQAPLEALLGVEYADGAQSLIRRSFSGYGNVDIKLQTDSTRDIRRVFGSLRVKSSSDLPLQADSITLTNTPLNGESYYIFNSQCNVLPPGQNRKKRIREENASAETSVGEASVPQSAGMVSPGQMGPEMRQQSGAPRPGGTIRGRISR